MGTAVTNNKPGQNQVANPKPQPPANRLRQLLETMKPQLAAALPKHLTPERMIRVVMTTVQKTPGLQECSEGSIIAAIVQASQLGLEPDGMLGRAYLIPRNNRKTGGREAVLQVGYKGLLELGRRSGEFKQVDTRVVYDGDYFTYEYGLEPKLTHQRSEKDDACQIAGPGGQGATHVYAVVHLTDGGVQFEVMTRGQVNAHRDRYSQRPKYGDWVWDTNWEEMAKKTCLIKVLKLCPSSIEMQTAIGLDTQNGLALAGVMDAAPALPVASSLDQLTDQLASKPALANPAASAGELLPPASVTELSDLAESVGFGQARLESHLKSQFGVTAIEDLTPEQGDKLRDYLEREGERE